MTNKHIKNKPDSNDKKIFMLFMTSLSKYELEFFFNFMKEHSDLSSSEKEELFKNENPELYDKIKSLYRGVK